MWDFMYRYVYIRGIDSQELIFPSNSKKKGHQTFAFTLVQNMGHDICDVEFFDMKLIWDMDLICRVIIKAMAQSE